MVTQGGAIVIKGIESAPDVAPVVFTVSGNVGRAIARAFAAGEAQEEQYILEELLLLGEELEGELEFRTPVSRGILRDSSFHVVFRDREARQWWLAVGQGAQNAQGRFYRQDVATGQPPGHRPPTDALRAWVQRRWGLFGKKLDRAVFALQQSIFTKGIDPNTFTERTVTENLDKIRRASGNIGQRLTVFLVDGIIRESERASTPHEIEPQR